MLHGFSIAVDFEQGSLIGIKHSNNCWKAYIARCSCSCSGWGACKCGRPNPSLFVTLIRVCTKICINSHAYGFLKVQLVRPFMYPIEWIWSISLCFDGKYFLQSYEWERNKLIKLYVKFLEASWENINWMRWCVEMVSSETFLKTSAEKKKEQVSDESSFMGDVKVPYFVTLVFFFPNRKNCATVSFSFSLLIFY